MDIKEFNNYVNRVNECLNVSKSTIEVNTLHLVITKIAFNILRKKGKISESQDKVERLGKINYAVDTICETFFLDRERLKNFFYKKVNHHYDIIESELAMVSSLDSMSCDYGEIDKNYDVSLMTPSLVRVLIEVL